MSLGLLVSAAGGVVLGASAGAVYAYLNDVGRYKGEIQAAVEELSAMGRLLEQKAGGEPAAEAPADPAAEHIFEVGAGR